MIHYEPVSPSMEIFDSKERKCIKLNIKDIPSLLLEMLT